MSAALPFLSGVITELEFVRREVNLGSTFAIDAFECAPDVFARVAELFAGTAAAAHQHSTRVMFEGVPIVVGFVAPGTIVFEGNVDETKMGDW